jgi:Tfp pilus assembly protein PilX
MAMFVSLIMLLLMTLIIVHGARTSTLEIFIANNVQNVAQALMRAEDSALSGETLIEVEYAGPPTIYFSENKQDGLYTDLEIHINRLDWSEFATEHVGDGEQLREYIIEYVGPVSALRGTLSIGAGAASEKRYLYRISGRGESSRGSTRVVQAIYATAE